MARMREKSKGIKAHGRRIDPNPDDQRELSKMGGHASRGGHGGRRENWLTDYEQDREARGVSRKRKLRVGFAAMDPEVQRAIASKGGKHSHDRDGERNARPGVRASSFRSRNRGL